MNEYLLELGKNAKSAAKVVRGLASPEKNHALICMAQALEDHMSTILSANQRDVAAARQSGTAEAMVERLTLTEDRVRAMAHGLRQVAQLQDPTLKTDAQWVNELGLRISKRRVPLGVIGMIYESRPNVTSDASGLCLKAGNAVILRGGREALESNQAIVNALQAGLSQSKVPATAVQLITDPDRELAAQFMTMNGYIDCLIPRGGAGLIRVVMKTATVPVIETGTGNCHLYIHQAADPVKAGQILLNGKVQRPSVCNALETCLIDEAIAKDHLVDYVRDLQTAGVEVRGDQRSQALVYGIEAASEEDYATEFLDNIIAVKVVSNYQEAVDHIDQYSSHHSDVIVTEDYSVAQDFMNDIDSAAVYVNASSRFSDGEVFGFGGEIGISTQKLHARGPMGLDALTSYKYVIEGQGQIRE